MTILPLGDHDGRVCSRRRTWAVLKKHPLRQQRQKSITIHASIRTLSDARIVQDKRVVCEANILVVHEKYIDKLSKANKSNVFTTLNSHLIDS